MVHLSGIFSVEDLEREIEEGWVRTNTHPTRQLYLLNYTEKTQYARHWNPVTLNCRGLIIDQYYNVVARPWKKFFNWSEPYADALPSTELEITNKQDGSLGILYTTDNLPFIATRGSFKSEQAMHATARWAVKYADVELWPTKHWTFLFEIVYPDNRIVLDYGDVDDLILLGAVGKSSGRYIGPGEAARLLNWPGPITTTFAITDLDSAIAMQRDNAEGLVLRHGNSMVKVKQEDYVALHKIVTGLNERTVWEHLKSGKDIPTICDSLPDEFHEWVNEVGGKLLRKFYEKEGKILEAFGYNLGVVKQHTVETGNMWTRKDFALQIKGSPYTSYMFTLLDGKDIDSMIWESLKPEVKS